ncbi:MULTISPECIES: alpha/beta hydrolase [unclassified Ruegeria]|uniref:alpha/beta hydrolase n=1 Tax=unclassified Ruegeria TaxID=2625375 RepID=UPI001490DD30|nr:MULTISPECIES: alpha/beta hydrolase [unclassified Ruegeria]
MIRKSVWLSVAALLLFSAAKSGNADQVFGYETELDVVYGTGKIAPDGIQTERELRMDVYSPSAANADYTKAASVSDGPHPAVIYVHGGAHHRGGRRIEPFRLEAAVHSRPEDYARLLAPLGYVVFVIEYRLATEYPEPALAPGEGNLIADVDAYITPQVFEATVRARNAMGLPRLENSPEDRLYLWKAGLAGAEDANLALEFVIENAERFNIDPERIAMGGHSAGGGITLNVGIGMDAPLAAIFPLSGPNILFEHEAVMDHPDLPPTLLAYSQFDEHTQLSDLPGVVSLLREAGVEYSLSWVPGFAHFYPHNAVSLGDDGTRMSLGDRIISFLDVHLGSK